MKTEFESLTNSKVEHHRPVGGGDDDHDHLIGGRDNDHDLLGGGDDDPHHHQHHHPLSVGDARERQKH